MVMLDIHPRQSIREKARDLLRESKRLPTVVKSNIFYNRAFTLLPGDLPAIKILGHGEDSEVLSISSGRQNRNFDLLFEIMTSSDKDNPAQDQADAIALGIEQTLIKPDDLGENVKSVTYKSYRLSDHDGKGQEISMVLIFEVSYEISGDDLGWFDKAPEENFSHTLSFGDR